MKATDNTLRTLTGYRLQRTTTLAMVRYKAVFARFGLRRTTFSCLSLIIETPGLRQSQLGETLLIERPNLVNIIEELTTRGWIEKTVSPEDRRAYSLRATPRGKSIFDKALAAVLALDREIINGLCEAERRALHAALKQLEKNAVHPPSRDTD